MTAHSKNTAHISFPIEKVYEAVSSKDYWTYEVENIGDEPGTVNSFTTEPIEAVLFELLPKSALPEAVRAMVPQDLKITRVVSFGQVNGTTLTGTVSAEVKGAPVTFTAEVSLTGEGESTTLLANSSVNVKIPMMGAMLEPKVAEWLGEFFTQEATLIEKWIGENL